MIPLLFLQAIVLLGAAQIGKPFAHLIFARLCFNIVFPLAVMRVKCSTLPATATNSWPMIN